MEITQDKEMLHELETELHVQIVPGTEVMVDVGNHHFVKSSAASDQVLVPQPSNDPHDPLNWSPLWKFSTLACASAVTFLQAMGPLAIAPTFPYLIEEFHSNFADVVDFTGIAILVLGFSNFIWVPLSTSFGRRPVYIMSTAICLASSIWKARATSYSSFYGACVLNGIAGGPGETIQPNVIADMMFLHTRGTHNTIYFLFYYGGLILGPILAGPMAQNTGWRSFWWLNVAMLGTTLVALIFGFPETKWHRALPNETSHEASAAKPSSPEKAAISVMEGDGSIEGGRSGSDMEDLSHAATKDRDPYLGKGYPSKAQFGFYTPNINPLASIALDIWIPWKLFAFPIVEFAAFILSFSSSAFLTLNLTQSEVFAAPPYNFSPLAVGFTNFAILAGGIIGFVTAGPLSDWISMRLTLRNRGIREPEMRLPTMIPYVLIMILGNFIVAFGYEQQWDWKVIVIIGYSCAGIQVAALPAITATYAVDSYKPVAGSIFVAATVNKNVYGYGFSKYITPWITKSGFVKPIMTNMTLITIWCSFGVRSSDVREDHDVYAKEVPRCNIELWQLVQNKVKAAPGVDLTYTYIKERYVLTALTIVLDVQAMV
ncbi:MAG: hypothetical protein Q9170_000298 [Blastenia crenularia]